MHAVLVSVLARDSESGILRISSGCNRKGAAPQGRAQSVPESHPLLAAAAWLARGLRAPTSAAIRSEERAAEHHHDRAEPISSRRLVIEPDRDQPSARPRRRKIKLRDARLSNRPRWSTSAAGGKCAWRVETDAMTAGRLRTLCAQLIVGPSRVTSWRCSNLQAHFHRAADVDHRPRC